MRLRCLLLLVLTAVAHAQEPVPLTDLTLPSEVVLDPWNKAAAVLTAQPDQPAELPAGTGSLKVAVHWPGATDFRFVTLAFRGQRPVPYRVRQLSLWLAGSGTKHLADLHLKGADGKDVKLGLPVLAFTGWKQVTLAVPPEAAQPLRLDALTFHNWEDRSAGDMAVGLARIEAVVDRSQVVGKVDEGPTLDLFAEQANGLVDPDGNGAPIVRLRSWQDSHPTVELSGTLTDWTGRSTPVTPKMVPLAGEWHGALPVRLERYGSYRLQVSAKVQGGPEATATARLARVVPSTRRTAAERLASPLGVNTHHPPMWDTLGKLGVDWARDYAFGMLEQGATAPLTANGLDFGARWRDAESAGITILPIAMGAFRKQDRSGFITDAAAIRAGYERFAKAFPAAPYWELDNEADLAFPGRKFDLANYQAYVAAAAKGLAGAGKTQVALNGTAGIFPEDTAALLASPVRDAFAVVNSHYYTGAEPPEVAFADSNTGGEEKDDELSFLDQLKGINRLAHAAGKQSWLTEVGWDVTNGFAVGERLQAVYLPRAYLLARWLGTDKVFWYFDRDVPGSTLRFSTCGLVDADGGVRPSGAAFAAMAQQLGLAQPAGRIDLGPGRWCLLFKHPDHWLAAAWTVRGEAPLPAELTGAPAVDLFGNPAKTTKLTDEVTYFRLDRLSPAWDAMRQVEWLSENTLSVVPGGTVTAEMNAPGARAAWGDLPAGVTAGPWQAGEAGRWRSTLTAAPNLALGTLPLQAAAVGQGWRREWPVSLRTEPAATVSAAAYDPEATLPLSIRAADPSAVGEARLSVPANLGAVYPPVLRLSSDRAQTALFVPAADQRQTVPLSLVLASGAKQYVWLRPRELTLPRAGQAKLDGELSEWPLERRIDPHTLVTHGAGEPSLWLAWAPEGLYLAARLPARELKPAAHPEAFWDYPSLELFADGGKGAHQVWLTPVREGDRWRLYAGEWKRGDTIPATVFDDSRTKTAMAATPDGWTLEALIPATLLGAVPQAGASWKLALAGQVVGGGTSFSLAWPVAKGDGLAGGGEGWGTARMR